MIGDGGLIGVGDEFDDWVSREDGVASLLVSAFDGFEEEGGSRALIGADESAVGEHRGELIGEHTDRDWDDYLGAIIR